MKTGPIKHSYLLPNAPSIPCQKYLGCQQVRISEINGKTQKFQHGCTFSVHLQDFSGDVGKEGPPNARRIPHSLHSSPVESRAGVWAAAKPSLSSSVTVPSGLVLAAKPGTAAATDHGLTVPSSLVLTALSWALSKTQNSSSFAE